MFWFCFIFFISYGFYVAFLTSSVVRSIIRKRVPILKRPKEYVVVGKF